MLNFFFFVFDHRDKKNKKNFRNEIESFRRGNSIIETHYYYENMFNVCQTILEFSQNEKDNKKKTNNNHQFKAQSKSYGTYGEISNVPSIKCTKNSITNANCLNINICVRWTSRLWRVANEKKKKRWVFYESEISFHLENQFCLLSTK